jgi:hypothetical protein
MILQYDKGQEGGGEEEGTKDRRMKEKLREMIGGGNKKESKIGELKKE